MSSIEPEKKKRGRKKGSVASDKTKKQIENTNEPKGPPKKRGRKPKGGKIIQQNVDSNIQINSEPNIILHLKCSMKDIQQNIHTTIKYDPNVENIKSFNFENKNDFLIQESLDKNEIIDQQVDYELNDDSTDESDNVKTIWKKLNQLKVKLHKNDVSYKRSACFWCTYEFDNPPIYIPRCEFKNSYQVYGCFCSPNCGVAYLMNEKIDSSVKYERYQLINHVYGKIYNYKKNIKPAPNPYYLLDKYYGNLSIKEYRELFNNEQLLIVVEKPLSHVLPELYEDNSDFIVNKKTIPTNSSYSLKRKSNVKKTNILENLGITCKN